MPRVDELKTSRPRHRTLPILLLILVVIVFVAGSQFITPPETALAAGQQLPAPPGAGNSDPESLAVSESTSPTTLIESPVTWVKLYFDPADGASSNIQIYNMPYDCTQHNVGFYNLVSYSGGNQCSPGGIIDDANHAIMYDFYNTDANENIGSQIYSIDGQSGIDHLSGQRVTTPRLAAWSTNINIPLGGTALSARSDYDVILMRVRWANCGAAVNNTCEAPIVPPPFGGTTRLNAFMVQTTQAQDKLGYWAQTGVAGTGVQPTFGSFTTHYIGYRTNYDIPNVEVDFAPPCSLVAPETATIRWKNGDVPWVNGGDTPGHDGNSDTSFAGAKPWLPAGFDQANSFSLFQISPTGVKTRVEFMPGGSAANMDAPGQPLPAIGSNASGLGPTNDIGGFQDYREVNFTAQPGYKYQWIWNNINAWFGNGNPPGNAHNVQMWIPYDSINYQLNCYDYHSTVTNAPGTVAPGTPVAPATLNFSNPASYTNMTFKVNDANLGNFTGPAAYVDPQMYYYPPGSVVPINASLCSGGYNPTWGNPLSSPLVPGGIPGNQAMTYSGQTFSCTLPAATANGTEVCFKDHILPETANNPAGIDSDPPDACYLVQNPIKYPSVVGLNGDVQAGNGTCGSAVPNTGNVEGDPKANSYGQYVVSANGNISNFGSNGTTGAGSGLLDLGNTGGYGAVCRENLYSAANVYFTEAGTSFTQEPPGTYDISGWSGVYYINGTAHLCGTVNNLTTVVEQDPASTLYFGGGGCAADGGNTQLTATINPASSVPSLGVIAAGNIAIDAGTTRVDAYLFANGTIDTCDTSSGGDCNSILNVNGFLMGKDLLFNRLGPLNAIGQQSGEIITLNPQIYLNPPPFFTSAAADSDNLEGLGEKPPLF
jgi:hypothetical protein